MSRIAVRDIVSIMVIDIPLLESLNELSSSLFIPPGDFRSWEMQSRTGVISSNEIVTNILQKWISMVGNKGTLEILLKVLKDAGFKRTADTIQEKFSNLTSPILIVMEIQRDGPPLGIAIPGSVGVLKPVKNYVGRQEKIEQLIRLLKTRDKSAVIISGLGGLGKTELTRKFVEICLQGSNPPFIAWLSGETLNTFSQSIWGVLSALSLASENRKEVDLIDGVRKICEGLQLKLGGRAVIIVIDNMDVVFNEIENVIKVLLDNDFFVVITSRIQGVLDGAPEFEYIDLDDFSDSEAESLLRKCLDPQKFEGEHMRQLCGRFQNLPLALQQAAAYIRVKQQTSLKGKSYGILEYLADFDKDLALLDHPMKFSNYNHSTLFVWDFTIGNIEKHEKAGTAAGIVLHMLALMNPDRISLEFLHKLGKVVFPFYLSNMDTVENTVSLLKKYSLVKVEEMNISIHRLVQTVVQLKMKPHSYFSRHEEFGKFPKRQMVSCNIALDLLLGKEAISDCTRNDIMNMLYIWENAIRLTKGDAFTKDFDFALATHNRLIDLSMVFEASNFAKRNYERCSEKLGENDSNSLLAKRDVARSLEFSGKYAEAYAIYNDLWLEMKDCDNFGEECEETLNTGHLLVSTLINLSRYDEALTLGKHILQVKREKLGNKHGSTLRTMHILALVHNRLRDYETALTLYDEALDGRIELLGDEHPYTLSTRSNIASCYFCQGDFFLAKVKFEAVLKNKVGVLGEDHLDTLMTKSFIARTFYHLGDIEQGIKIMVDVLAVREKLLGKDHPHTEEAEYWIRECQKKIKEGKGNELIYKEQGIHDK